MHQTFPNTQNPLIPFVPLLFSNIIPTKKHRFGLDDVSHPKSRNSVGESIQLATLGCAPLAGKEAQSTVVNWGQQFFALSFLKWMKIVNLSFFLKILEVNSADGGFPVTFFFFGNLLILHRFLISRPQAALPHWRPSRTTVIAGNHPWPVPVNSFRQFLEVVGGDEMFDRISFCKICASLCKCLGVTAGV